MNSEPSKHTEPLALHGLLTPDERRLTVAGHHEWRESISSPPRDFDPIDELVAELRATQPEDEL
jgi:hypothetical protein